MSGGLGMVKPPRAWFWGYIEIYWSKNIHVWQRGFLLFMPIIKLIFDMNIANDLIYFASV